jgi:hypothetical protein
LGHTLLVIMYHLLRDQTTYRELGGDFLERLEPDRLTRHLVRRLEKLGHDVVLRPKENAAQRVIFRVVQWDSCLGKIPGTQACNRSGPPLGCGKMMCKPRSILAFSSPIQ